MRLSATITRLRSPLFCLFLATTLGTLAWGAKALAPERLRATNDTAVYLPISIGRVGPPVSAERILYSIGEQTAFGYQTNLFTIDPEGTNKRRVTEDFHQATLGRWSPDRQTIAFSRDTPQSPYQIGLMNPNGGNIRPLSTPGIDFTGNISWSPDGRTLVFEALDSLGQWELMTIEVDGTNLTNLTADLPGYAHSPNWSPDGRHILFVYDDGQQYDLLLMNPDGSGRTNLTNSDFPELAPDWSPDGQTILFTSTTGFTDAALYTMPASGGEPALLLEHAGSGRWSPNGKQIVFLPVGTIDSGIHRVDSQGQIHVPVDPTDGAGLPDW